MGPPGFGGKTPTLMGCKQNSVGPFLPWAHRHRLARAKQRAILGSCLPRELPTGKTMEPGAPTPSQSQLLQMEYVRKTVIEVRVLVAYIFHVLGPYGHGKKTPRRETPREAQRPRRQQPSDSPQNPSVRVPWSAWPCGTRFHPGRRGKSLEAPALRERALFQRRPAGLEQTLRKEQGSWRDD